MISLEKRAGVLAAVFFLTQCLFAYQPEHGFWAQRRRAARDQRGAVLASVPGGSLAAQFPAAQSVGPSLSRSVVSTVPPLFLKEQGDLLSALSPAHGSLRKISLPQKNQRYWKTGTGRSPVVVHIQDVHMNAEAQRNIRDAVSLLLQSGRVDVMGLEGSTDEIDLQPFVDFPSRRAVKASADFVLGENKITGPVHAAMTAQGRLPRILGIDDPVHYAANVQAYRDAVPLLSQERQRINENQQTLAHEKARVCSADLKAFDDAVVAFEDEKISLGDYVLEMSNRARSVPEQVKRFTQALKMERALDFRQVEKERAALIGVLAERLNRDETGALLAQSAAYRAGKMGYGVFYDHLQNLCQSKEVPLARFPAMDAYVRYVLLADGIDAEQLFKELVRLEKSIYAALAVTSKEKDWVARSREGRLLKKLVNFSMTPADWKEYEPLAGRPEMAPFEAFYKEAHIRDGAMADNLLKALETGQGTTAILVTGGYHAEGIADRLTAQGVTVLSYVPKIEKIDTTQGSAYLSVFSQEKTPLEKLFAGEKLFLGHNPAGGVNEAALLTETLQRVGIPSDAVRSKIEGYLTQHYQGHRLTFGEHFRRTDGLWVAPVHLFDGKQTITFSVVYRLEGNKITIQSFGLAEREDRSPFGAFVGKIIWAHNKLAPVAVWVSLVTVFLLFVFIPSWTPDPFWNGLGLFALAANTSVVDAGSIDGQRRIHPANPAHPDYKELKMLGPDREKAAENGGLITNIKILVLKKGKRKGKRVNLYLLLEKKEKKLANQQEGPPALKLDIPGGGAAGKTEGISLPKGGQREFREEVGLKNVNIARFRDLGLAKRNEYRFYSIPGPKANFTNRRPTIFRRVNLTNKEANGLQTSTEHEGHLWLTLPEALDRFDDLNTASKMAFYLEFLRLAYGITRVRSLRVLTETRRLKSMTDPVLIETDGGSFIWSPNGEVNLHKPEGFSVEGRMDRVASNKSVLDEWENPRVFREMGGETLPIPLVMWRLKNESRSIQLLKFLFHDGVAATTGDRSSAQINFLASRVPPGEVALSSFRFLVMREEKYVFLVRNGRKNECVGGVGINPEERLSYVENQLRVPKGSIGSTSLSAGLKSFIIHKIGNGVRFNYVEVEDGTIHLELKSPIEDKGIIELDYDQLKQQYYDFSLSARMLIMKEIVKREYGYHVSSIRPIRSSQEGGVSQIILTTDKGPFVFRPANTVIDDKKNAVRVRVKPDGSNGLYVNIGGLNFILTQRKSRSSHYEIVRRQLQERQAAVQRGDWIPLFRKIALGIKSSPEIWSELLNAQKQIVAEQGNAGIVRKPDHSLVTEWDFKLQLAFKDMIQQSGLPAQVRGEGRTLNPDFLKRLPGQDQDRVIDLVLNNAADMPEGLVFYVVPLDGTKNFTEGGKEFAFTFGVLYDGDPLYAATYLPAQDDLYEAVVKERALYKNGEQVMSRKARVFFRSKNQQDLHPHLKKMIQVVRRARNKHLAASSEGTGQATSLWMTKLFELVGAGVDRFVSPQKKGRQEEKSYEVRFGIHYKRNAPRYELGLAVGAMVINLLWVNSVWMGVGSAVLFIVSHHKFKFLDLKTDVKPSPFKVIVMALIYGTLIAISPGVVQGLVHGMGAEVVVDFLMVFVGWHAAYGLHRYFDPPWRAAINVDDTLGIKPLSLAYWTSRYFGLSETYARLLGGLEMLVQISLLVWLRLGIESVVPNGSGLFALMGFDPIFGPLFFMGLLYLFWANYMLMSVVANREGYDPPQIKNLVGPLAVFLFLVPTPLGLGFGAFFYLAYYWNHLVDQSTGPKRILSADEKTKKGRTIKLLSSLPDGINSTGENVMSVRVIIKIIVGGLFGFSERYLLVQNREGRWELPGGGGEQNENVAIAAIREIHQELGRQFALAFVRLMRGGPVKPGKPQFFHDLTGSNKRSYRAVSVIQAKLENGPSVHLNDESLAHRWMTLKQAMRMYMGFTLNTRMALLNPILESEYGVTGIINIVPMDEEGNSGVEGSPLRITTKEKVDRQEIEKVFILRHRDQNVNMPEGITKITLHRKNPSFFQKPDILPLSRQPMILEEIVDDSGDDRLNPGHEEISHPNSVLTLSENTSNRAMETRRINIFVRRTNSNTEYFLKSTTGGWALPEVNGERTDARPLFVLKRPQGIFAFQVGRAEGQRPDERPHGQWLSLVDIMDNMIWQLPLSSRLALVGEILYREYGIDNIVSIEPAPNSPRWADGPALILTTEGGKKYVFRSAGIDQSEAQIHSAVQTFLRGKGIPTRTILEPRESIEGNPFCFFLGGHPMMLEDVTNTGNSYTPASSTMDHFFQMGLMAGKIESFFRDSNLSGSSLEKHRVVSINLDYVTFDDRGKIESIDLYPIPPGWGYRHDVLKSMSKGVTGINKIRKFISGYETNTYPLTWKEKVDFWKFYLVGLVKGNWVAKGEKEKSSHLPSTLQWFWDLWPNRVGELDDILNRAPWERAVLMLSAGVSVVGYLIGAWSVGWVLAVPVLAGVLGYSHVWGTYGMVEGKLGRVRGIPTPGKAVIWFTWTLVFAGFLILLGQAVSLENIPWVMALATAAGARVSYLVHRKENRNWVINNLTNLTPDQRLVARDVLIALEGKPLRLGVGDLRERVYEMAEKNAMSEGGFSIELGVPSVTGEGVTFFMVDPLTLEKTSNTDRLNALLAKNPNRIAIVPQPVEGLPQNQVIVSPGSFDKNGVGYDVIVSGLRDSILKAAGDRPFQIMTSPLLTLNTANMAEEDPVRKASDNAVVYVLELLRGFSAKAFRWPDVLKAFRALAEAA